MKFPYSGAKMFEIFTALHRRGLAMFLGYQDGEPMIWLSERAVLTRAPVSIATADMILQDILDRELEGRTEVLIGEVLDGLVSQRKPQRARRVLLIGS